MKISKVLVLFLFASLLSGCISPKSYIDPKYAAISEADLKQLEERHIVSLDVEFMRNGERFESVDEELKSKVEMALVKSGVVSLAENEQPIKLKVVCNNIADIEAAVAQGFGTGLTLGLSGTAITDYYEIHIEMTQGGTILEKKYEHALHSTIGNKAAPFPVEPISPEAAFEGVIEDVIFEFIKEMQETDVLTFRDHRFVNTAT